MARRPRSRAGAAGLTALANVSLCAGNRKALLKAGAVRACAAVLGAWTSLNPFDSLDAHCPGGRARGQRRLPGAEAKDDAAAAAAAAAAALLASGVAAPAGAAAAGTGGAGVGVGGAPPGGEYLSPVGQREVALALAGVSRLATLKCPRRTVRRQGAACGLVPLLRSVAASLARAAEPAPVPDAPDAVERAPEVPLEPFQDWNAWFMEVRPHPPLEPLLPPWAPPPGPRPSRSGGADGGRRAGGRRQERTTAVLMALHPRLGAGAAVRELDEASLCTILALACTLDIAAGALADQLARAGPSD